MILLHLSSLETRPVLWAERSLDQQPQARAPRRQKSRSRTPKKFLYDAGKDGLRLLHQQWGDAAPPITRTEKAIAWLPTIDGHALVSSPLISPPPDSIVKPQIKPWSITVVELSWEHLIHFLCSCGEKRAVAEGVVLGSDVLFWRAVMRFAGSLVARQQYLPGVSATTESFHARWQPVFLGADKERFALLLKAMPAVVHALTRSKPAKPAAGTAVAGKPNALAATMRNRLLTDIITGFVDYLVRSTVADDGSMTLRPSWRKAPKHKGQGDAFESLHSQWLHALRASESKLSGDTKALKELAEQVAQWRRPTDHISESRLRLCFQLHEPDASTADRPLRKKAADDAWHVEYLLQQHDDPSLLLPVKRLWKGKDDSQLKPFTPLGLSGSRRIGNDAREYLLLSLGQASALSRHVEQSLKTPAPGGYVLDNAGAHEFLTQQALTFEQAGFGVFLPAWWTRKGTKLRLTARVEVQSPSMKATGNLSMDTIVAFNWKVALGDEVLTREELERLARLKAPLVKLRGQWVELNSNEIRAAIEFWKNRPTETTTVNEIIRMKLGAAAPLHGLALSGITATGWVDGLLRHLDGHSTFEELQPPSRFSGTLRPYQVRGYSWMAYLKSWGLGACLADDMGLGKTIQALAMIQRDWANGAKKPVLLVCPTSVVNNWRKEASRFTPNLPMLVHHGASRKKGKAFKADAKNHAIVISTYSLLHRDQNHLQETSWGGIVLDEAQNIKNAETKQARAARALKTGYRLALTGTPVENNVGDLWSMMEFLNPGFLGSQAEFKRRFFVPIHTRTDPGAAERLRTMTGPFILRRLKTDKAIISDLPEKMEMKVFCTLTKEQASLYASVLKDVDERLTSSEGIERKGLILATLSKLKQVCNHPAHFLGDNSSIPGRSGKVARLTEMVEEIVEVGDKALVFSQFAEMGGILKKHLQETFGREMFFLHGGVPRKQRDQMVDRFQNEQSSSPVFILSLKAGGTGLNLTRANHVFHFDRWWNPAVENQATDRAFRIGQSRNVQVHKFICAGTLEEKIDEMIERKKEIAEMVVGTGEGWLTELSTEELKEILTLRTDMIGD